MGEHFLDGALGSVLNPVSWPFWLYMGELRVRQEGKAEAHWNSYNVIVSLYLL